MEVEEEVLLACCILQREVFSVFFLARQFINLADGSQRTGFAVELSRSPAVIDGTSRSLCLGI